MSAYTPEAVDSDQLAHGGADEVAVVDQLNRLPSDLWLPVLQLSCDFPPDIFESVSLNLIKNPNINSSLLFRADVLYDSWDDELTDQPLPRAERDAALHAYNVSDGDLVGFHVKRRIIRRMIPRNPQLDKPIAQTCIFLQSDANSKQFEYSLVIYIPHTSEIDSIPWYHPRIQSLAYLHSWNHSSLADRSHGAISLHYKLYPSESLPLSTRLTHTGQNLLSTVHKHGQGQLAGYTKRVHHDQLISQQRLQDRYTELKQKHAKRLCERWVEKTEPSKHVFEDLGIAAFLIELWKDMYRDEDTQLVNDFVDGTENEKPTFPGFVDIGCGNGVLIDILIREGYPGWGFDARKRKTWATFDEAIQEHVKELILVPQPLLNSTPISDCTTPDDGGIVAKVLSHMHIDSRGKNTLDGPEWHNGIFPTGTYIISNHADELTPWTPLLASISSSPFLAIPCCSHNLSGLRFRAPSVFNNNSADALAPSYFSAHVNKSKSIAIAVACSDNEVVFGQAPEKGDLRDLNAKSRAKQPSAYSSLCDWVAHLSARVGYKVEREVLRLPSTRNVGIIGRAFMPDFADDDLTTRRVRVAEIASKEKADGVSWVERARGLTGGQDGGH